MTKSRLSGQNFWTHCTSVKKFQYQNCKRFTTEWYCRCWKSGLGRGDFPRNYGPRDGVCTRKIDSIYKINKFIGFDFKFKSAHFNQPLFHLEKHHFEMKGNIFSSYDWLWSTNAAILTLFYPSTKKITPVFCTLIILHTLSVFHFSFQTFRTVFLHFRFLFLIERYLWPAFIVFFG